MLLQVGALVAEWLGNLPETCRNRVKAWLYDDMCHLAPIVDNEKLWKQPNELSKFMKNLEKSS